MSEHVQRNAGSDPTHGAVLPRYILEIKLRPYLSDITLDNILSGDTCSPIGLDDFEDYLMYKEYTVENLQFIVWYQDYRARYFAHSKDPQAMSDARSNELAFAIPSAPRAVQGIMDRSAPASSSISSDQQSSPTAHDHSISEQQRHKLQHFRHECSRVVVTFFKAGAEKELSLDANMRDGVIHELTASNTHPDVFLPVYNEIYATLSTVSLPRFLTDASTNVNRPKQYYWYGMGLAYFVLTIVIAAAVPTRAWRLFSVPFSGMGCMSVHSGWRGFCTEVWARGTTQLRTWELQKIEDENPIEADRDHDLPAGAGAGRENVPDRRASLPGLLTYHGLAKPAAWLIEEKSEGDGAIGGPDVSEPPSSLTFAGLGDLALHGEKPEQTASLATIVEEGHRNPQEVTGVVDVWLELDAHVDSPIDTSSAAAGPSNPVPLDSSAMTLSPPVIPPFPEPPSSLTTHTPAVPLPTLNDVSLPIGTSQRAFAPSVPPMFGPERVVLDPRIRAVHRQVMLDLLRMGTIWTVLFMLLVVCVPSRR